MIRSSNMRLPESCLFVPLSAFTLLAPDITSGQSCARNSSCRTRRPPFRHRCHRARVSWTGLATPEDCVTLPESLPVAVLDDDLLEDSYDLGSLTRGEGYAEEDRVRLVRNEAVQPPRDTTAPIGSRREPVVRRRASKRPERAPLPSGSGGRGPQADPGNRLSRWP